MPTNKWFWKGVKDRRNGLPKQIHWVYGLTDKEGEHAQDYEYGWEAEDKEQRKKLQ